MADNNPRTEAAMTDGQHSTNEAAGNLTGSWVEYHGSYAAWQGRQLLVTDRSTTPYGPRYTLADRYGRPVLSDVRPGSVTILRSVSRGTWTDRITAVRIAAEKLGQHHALQLAPYIDAISAMIEDEDFRRAQRALIDLEAVLGIVDAATYLDAVAETMILIAPCIACGELFMSNPSTVPAVWIHEQTRCPLRPDTTHIEPGEPGTQRAPLCAYCAAVIRDAIGQRIPVQELFPHARLNASVHERDSDETHKDKGSDAG